MMLRLLPRLSGLAPRGPLRAAWARIALACLTVATLLWLAAAGPAVADERDATTSGPILLAAHISDWDEPAGEQARIIDLARDDDEPTATISDSVLATDSAPEPTRVGLVTESVKSWSAKLTSWAPQGMVPYVGTRTPDAEKDLGIGWPIAGPGWRTNPFSVSGFSGFSAGATLIPGHVHLLPSYYGGVNFGWDYDHYWGFEKRLGFGALSLTDGQHHAIGGDNLSITGEYRLMYYPLGDATWRPFVTTGLGWSDFYFHDDQGDRHLDTVGMVPFGLGVKYLHREHWALRVDLIDELTIGAGSLSTFHYVALTAGLEVRYGKRLLKMPWHHDE